MDTLDNPDSAPQVSEDDENHSSYQKYFASGTYDRRYPAPNRTTWHLVQSHLGEQAAVLDFGCGSGRYLFQLRGRVGRAVGFDVSPAALEMVRGDPRARDWDALSVLGPEPEMLDAHIEQRGPFDLVLCLFGVLGHITNPETRREALVRMARALKPETGRLLISVPNKARRFKSEQASRPMERGLVRYSRLVDGVPVQLHYQLFDPGQLTRELEEAGLHVHSLRSESVMPESWLLHHGLARSIDAVLTRACPARWGYGILAEAAR